MHIQEVRHLARVGVRVASDIPVQLQVPRVKLSEPGCHLDRLLRGALPLRFVLGRICRRCWGPFLGDSDANAASVGIAAAGAAHSRLPAPFLISIPVSFAFPFLLPFPLTLTGPGKGEAVLLYVRRICWWGGSKW